MYLIVPSRYGSDILAFTVDCCFTTSCLYTQSQPVNNVVTLTEPFPSPLKSGTNQAVAYFNSVFLQTTNYPTNNFGQSIDATIINSTHFSLIFTNVASVAMNIGFYVVSVIAYYDPTPSLGITIIQNVAAIAVPVFVSTDAANTFFGLYSFIFTNGKMNFKFNYVGNTMTLVWGTKMSRCRLRTITFGFGQCCAPTPYVDPIQSVCIDECPPRMFLQSNTVNCLPCAYDCFNCSNNSTCTACDNSTDKRQFNSTTNRCVPIYNYYESGATVAALCTYPNCCGDAPIIFTAQSVCASSCPSRTYLDNSTMDCLLCAYDC